MVNTRYALNLTSELPVRGIHFFIFFSVDQSLRVGNNFRDGKVGGECRVAGSNTLPPVNETHRDDWSKPERELCDKRQLIETIIVRRH